MRYLSTASPGVRLEGNRELSIYISPNCSPDHLILDISNATSMTIEDICPVLNQQGMIWGKRGNTPFSPSMKPSPGQSIRFVRGRKNGTARKHLQRRQTDDDLSQGPFAPPKEYEIVWDPEVVKAYLTKWNEKGYLTLKPEKLKWSPFILQRTTKPVTSAPLTTVDHGTEVQIVDVTVKKGKDGKSRSVVVEERRTPSVSTNRDDESSIVSFLHTQDQAMSPASSSRLKAQVEQDHKLALKLANTTTPSTRRTRLRSRDASTPQVDHTPTPDTPITRSRRTNGKQSSNGTSSTPNVRSPSVMSTVSRLRDRERRSRSGSAARSAVTRSQSALKTPSIADIKDHGEDEEEDDDRDAEGDEDGDGDYVDVDVDEDEKLAMRLAEEEARRAPTKRLRSRSGTSSNRQSSDFVLPAHVDEDLLRTSGPGIKRSDSSRPLTRKRMRIDSSPIMEDSLALQPEDVKHSPPTSTLVDLSVTFEQGFIPVNGFETNGTHSDPMSLKADSPPALKMERIPEDDLHIVASLAALKNGGRFSDVPSPVKDPTTIVPIITPISTDVDPTSPNQIPNQVLNIGTTDDHGPSDNSSDPPCPRTEEEEDEYGDLDAEGELDDEEGIDIEAVL